MWNGRMKALTFSFDYADGWERIERFCQMMSGRDDIFYGTNDEVFQYFGLK